MSIKNAAIIVYVHLVSLSTEKYTPLFNHLCLTVRTINSYALCILKDYRKIISFFLIYQVVIIAILARHR